MNIGTILVGIVALIAIIGVSIGIKKGWIK